VSDACADDFGVSRRGRARLSFYIGDLGRRLRLRGQLQHACILICAEMREQHDLAIRELKGIMVHVRIVQVDLPEQCHLVTDVLRSPLEKGQPKSPLALDLLLERNLCARKKAHGHLRFSNRGKPACRGTPKFRCDQLVADLCRSGRNIVQTVVALAEDLLSLQRSPTPSIANGTPR